MKKLLFSLIFSLTVLFSINGQNYPNIVNYYINGTPTNGVKIKTNLPFANWSQMPYIQIVGYNYATGSTIDLNIGYYIYNNSFNNYTISSSGGYIPKVKLSNESGKVIVFIDDKSYFQRFTVSVYANGLGENNHPEYFQGWTAVDESLTGTNTVELKYSNKFKKLGIGIDNPSAGLHVNTCDTIAGQKVVAILGNEYDHWTNFGGVSGGRIRGAGGFLVLDANPSGSDKTVYINLESTTGNIVMNKYNNANVGIGTTPAVKLDVYGTYNDNSNSVIAQFARNSSMSTGGSSIIRLGYNSTSDIELNSGYSNTGFRYGNFFDLNIVNNNTDGTYGGVNFVTNGLNRMAIGANGNVGIGITTPSYGLDISDNSLLLGSDSINRNRTNNITKISRFMKPHNINTEEPVMMLYGSGSEIKMGGGSSTANAANRLSFWTASNTTTLSGSEKMTILGNGNVGIGVQIPTYKLQVSGNTTIDGVLRVNGSDSISGQKVAAILGNNYQSYTCFGAANGGRIRGSNEGYLIIEGNPNGYSTDKSVYINSYTSNGNVLMTAASGKVGIGINSPLAKFSVNGSWGNPSISGTTQPAIASFSQNNNSSTLYVGSSSTSPSNTMWLQASSKSNLSTNYSISLNPNGGNVGIGTINPQNALDVRGTIRASEVKVVDISQIVPDFVFDKNYILPSLNDVESYVNKNGHLPNIPSATEVKENGMSLVDMNLKLLQKVEELTLYVIEQQKQIEELKSKVK